MRNQNYDAEALAESVLQKARAAQDLVGQLYRLSSQLKLTGDEYDQHAHDHAEEKLAWVATEARKLADGCDRLRRYTNYPPVEATR